jgi:DNA ligase-1
VRFLELVEAFEAMEATTKRLELTSILKELFLKAPPELLDKIAYMSLGKLCPDYMGIEIGVAERLAIRAIALSSGLGAQEVEALYKRLGDLGSAAAEALANKKQATFLREPLTVQEVYETALKMAKATGPGSVEGKIRLLASLLNDAEPKEAKYILRMVTGKLRLGVADYTLLDAAAEAFAGGREKRPLLERAYNITSDIGLVIKTLATQGLDAVTSFTLEVGRPVRPMLAERLTSAEEVLQKIGAPVQAEYKLDGERIQVHKNGEEVELFSRRLENITMHYPDVVQLVRQHLRARTAIAEGEAVAIDEATGEFLPFQELMHRRRKYGIEEAMKAYPVALYLFDLLYYDGRDLTQEPLIERRRALEQLVTEHDMMRLVPCIMAERAEELEAWMARAIGEGCEGLVCKDPRSTYRAGAREFAWIKLKREYKLELADTLDVVIVGAFHGRGKRAGRFGAYLCAVYDKQEDVFRSVCKVGTGFTDEDLAKFTEMVRPLVRQERSARVDSKLEPDVWIEPRLVIEVAASEITLSPIHTAAVGRLREGVGLALRFPKFTGRLRDDKAPEDATTVEELLEMYSRQKKKAAEERAEPAEAA